MTDRPTPKHLDDAYAKLLAAIVAQARAGRINADDAISEVQRIETSWRSARFEVVQHGFTRMITDIEATGDPTMRGLLEILTEFRDDPETPMLRRHCDCGGRLIERAAVDPPEDGSPLVRWRCVECATLYDVAGNARGKDPSR